MTEKGSVRSLNAARDDAGPVLATARGFCVTADGFSVGARPFRRVRRVPAGAVLTPSRRTVLLFPEADGRFAAKAAAKDPASAAFPAFEIVPPSGRFADAASRIALSLAVLFALGVASTTGAGAVWGWSEGPWLTGKSFADAYLVRNVHSEAGMEALFKPKPSGESTDAYWKLVSEKTKRAREARKAEGAGE